MNIKRWFDFTKISITIKKSPNLTLKQRNLDKTLSNDKKIKIKIKKKYYNAQIKLVFFFFCV